jgi:glycosyltransferase involved in cell wall biosynthesis
VRIAIDVDVLVNEAKTGVYSYNQQLLRALLELDHQDDYVLSYFGAPKSLDELGLPAQASATTHNTGWFPRRLYNLSLRTPLALPFDLMTGTSADLFIFTKFVRWPLWRRRPSIVFVYDTAFVDYPDLLATQHFRRYLAQAVPRSLRVADHIVVISQNTKHSLIDHYGVAASKLSVITPAIDHDLFKPAGKTEQDRVAAKYGITSPYILSLGTLEPRKNLVTLMRALDATPLEFKRRYTLVLAGGKGWQDEAIERLYQQLKTEMTVVKTGFVENEDLPGLYSGAKVFVFPSLYEGFGMPPLEAMACGTPVIAANNSSLPEVVGKAGILVDATDTKALQESLVALLADPKRAADLAKQGLARAKTFTWRASAEELLEIIKTTGAGS